MMNWLGKIFGTKNDKEIKKYRKIVDEINKLEESYRYLSDEDLKAKFWDLRDYVRDDKHTVDEILKDVFAITREAAKRTLNMRHYDVQLIGGMVLHAGRIAEMKTGEGKTLVATLPVILNAIKGKDRKSVV